MPINKTGLKIVHCFEDEQGRRLSVSQDTKASGDAIHRDFVDYVFKQYQKAITRYLISRKCSKEDADDILQETYIRIVNAKNLEQLETRARSYIFKTALNIWRDKIRRDSTQQKYKTAQNCGLEIPISLSDPDSQVQSEQALTIVKNCLLEVPPRQRKVFLLRVIESLAFAEIAKILSVSVKTVQRDYLATLALCKERLGRRNIE